MSLIAPPPQLRHSIANAAIFLAAGCGVAFALSAALGGEATWSVSTGVGAALAAGVYEVGRPARLSGAQAAVLDEQWVDFRAFADARLARKGRCHGSEIELAYRRFSPSYNARRRGDEAANAAGDADLRNFIANWNPAGASLVLLASTVSFAALRADVAGRAAQLRGAALASTRASLCCRRGARPRRPAARADAALRHRVCRAAALRRRCACRRRAAAPARLGRVPGVLSTPQMNRRVTPGGPGRSLFRKAGRSCAFAD